MILGIALVLVGLAGNGGSGPLPGTRGHTLILTDGLNSAYDLEHRLLVLGTDTVVLDGRMLPRTQYLLDYGRGSLVFFERPPALSAVLVSYRYIPFSGAAAGYRLHRLAAPEVSVSETTAAAPEPVVGDTLAQGELDVSGSKSVGITIGGVTGSGINQSTRLSVLGTIEGVGIEAELSDQSSGIPAEGTTREIAELDRIIIRLKGRNWQGNFGDVDLGLAAPGLGRVERRAVGATVSARAEAGSVELGYARPRGRFGHVVLSGREGVQGPYLLAPDQRQAQLVPASERVYLDGARMTRGWDADYTIDYSTAEVVFTGRRVIDRYSRIEALFEYVVEAYERSDITAGASTRLGPVEIETGVFREGDDPGRPGEELSAEEVEYLAGIGADSTRAWLEGGRFVGAGQGSYVRESQGYYRYAGEMKGDYDVTFTFVGDSLGGYAYDDTLLAYRYAGESSGDYVAKRRVTLPGREEMLSVGVRSRGSEVSAGVTGLFRRRMANLFAVGGAGLDDGAVAAQADWSRERFAVSYAGRFQALGFQLPGQDSVLDFGYRWAGANRDEMRSTNELAVEARPGDRLRLAGEAGVLDRATAGAVARLRGQARYDWLSLGASRVGREARYEMDAGPSVWLFAPRFGLELYGKPAEYTRRLNAGVGVSPAAETRVRADYRYDDVSTPDTTGVRARDQTGGLAQAEAEWSSGDAVRLEARVTRQSRKYAREPQRDWTQWLGSLTGSASPWGGVRLWTDLNQSYRLVQLRDEVFRYVGKGNGEYSRDSVSGRYYRDTGGEYERLLVARGRFASCRERNVAASAEVAAWRPLALSGSFSSLATADSAPLQELLNHSLRVTVRQLEPVLTASVGTVGNLSMDRTLAATGRQTSRGHEYLELRSGRIPRLDVTSRIERHRELRRYSADLVDYSEEGWRLELAPVIGGLGLELTAALDWSWIESPAGYPELGRFRLVTREVGAARSASIGRRARARGSVSLIEYRASVAELPFEVALSRPLGFVPSAGLELTHLLSDVLTSSARYRYSDRADRPAEHQFSAELRASF